jgi:hypothetical protein
MKSVYITKTIHYVQHREHIMLPLEKPTRNYSIAMVLNLGCQMAFRGVRDIPEFNFTVKLKQIFNFVSFTEVYILDKKN